MIILDIDLDYFDNTNQHNADEFTIATFDERIDLFLGLLRTIDLSRLALISIARSPGFCPERMASIISAELQKGTLKMDKGEAMAWRVKRSHRPSQTWSLFLAPIGAAISRGDKWAKGLRPFT